MSSRKEIAPPPPVVVFAATCQRQPLGSIIQNNFQKDSAPCGFLFLFTTMGNTQAEMMHSDHAYVERTLTGVICSNSALESKGWRITTFDSAESDKKWIAQNVDALLSKKEFPVRIGSGITPDVQSCACGKNMPSKARAREEQEDHDLQKAIRAVSAPKSIRLDILRRLDKANRAADEQIDAELIFKQGGTTRKLNGFEDHRLASSLKVAWAELQIVKFRTKYMADHQPWQLRTKELFYSL